MSAGASFQTGIAAGKFHGVISPTTPSGRRIVQSRWFVTDGSKTSPTGLCASPAEKRRIAAVRAASPRASRKGLPISAVMSCAICSERASSASAAL